MCLCSEGALWCWLCGAGFVQGILVGQRKEQMAPGGSWERDTGRAHEADRAAWWLRLGKPWGVGSCRRNGLGSLDFILQARG